MSSKFKPTRILGHVVDTGLSAMNARETSKVGYIPEDERLLQNLGILQKNKAPLGSVEEIRQFFRWSVSSEKYPLPPLVRKILCINRARLVDAMDSMKTSRPTQTYEKNAIAEIDRFLREDGVKTPTNPDLCISENKKEGSWLKGGVIPEPAIQQTSCVYDDSKVIAKIDGLKTYLSENCCKEKSCPSLSSSSDSDLKTQISELQKQVEQLTQLLKKNEAVISAKTKVPVVGATTTTTTAAAAEPEGATTVTEQETAAEAEGVTTVTEQETAAEAEPEGVTTVTEQETAAEAEPEGVTTVTEQETPAEAEPEGVTTTTAAAAEPEGATTVTETRNTSRSRTRRCNNSNRTRNSRTRRSKSRRYSST